ncbi:MAG: hypothetical protein QM765_18720 [Myxococcales bacterium]
MATEATSAPVVTEAAPPAQDVPAEQAQPTPAVPVETPAPAAAAVPEVLAAIDEPLTAASRLTLIASPEVNLVGLAYGVRFEIDYRPFEPGTVSRFRFALAFDYGPEFFYLPVALGYRAVFRQDGIVRPLVGVGLELQSFFITDAPTIRNLSGYLEGGVLFALDSHWEIGFVASLEYAPLFSPGLCTRLQIGHTF